MLLYLMLEEIRVANKSLGAELLPAHLTVRVEAAEDPPLKKHFVAIHGAQAGAHSLVS